MGVITAPVRLDPLISTGNAAPTGALGGLIPVRTGPEGAGGNEVSNERLLLCPDDVKTLAPSALSHRIIVTADAIISGRSAQVLVREIVDEVDVPIAENP